MKSDCEKKNLFLQVRMDAMSMADLENCAESLCETKSNVVRMAIRLLAESLGV